VENESLIKRLSTKIVRSPALGSFVFLAVEFIIFGITRPNFLTMPTMAAITQAAMITIVVGMSQMATLAIGGMNLAIGAMGGFAAIICGSMMQQMGFATPVAILLGLAAGTLCGLINGVIISTLGASSVMTWLVTMATTYVFTGLQKAWNRGQPFQSLHADFNRIGFANIGGIPLLMYVVVILTILVFLFFRFTGMGRQMLAYGANPSAAVLNGINKKKVVIFGHSFSGLLAGAAGVLLAMRMNAVTVDFGSEWAFYSFASPIIGGVIDGRVSPLGTFFGGLVLATIDTALVQFNVDIYWNQFIKGLIILFAVVFNTLRENMLARRR